jgi:ABC-type uncharacterized transport system substrate-binding protein
LILLFIAAELSQSPPRTEPLLSGGKAAGRVPSAEASCRNDSEKFFRVKIIAATFKCFFCSRLPAVLAHCANMAAAELAAKNRLPAIYARGDFVASGGLVSYGADQGEPYRRTAVFVDKILKGTKPADIPVEQPTKFEFIINLKAAKQIGLTVPPNVLARADKVIK